MRRSRSSSNIPRFVRENKNKRSDSLGRSQQSPGINILATPVYQLQIPGSLTRKTNVYDVGTPSSASSRLSRYRPSSSNIKSFGSIRRSRSPNIQSVQKLLSDKKWLNEQYAKVQLFITNSGLFDPEMASAIRPPTINTLLLLFSGLFNKLIAIGPINVQNYSDMVSKTLKLLMYPGNVSASSIKSANTMHGWPQLIAITSWLIDRINLTSTPLVIETEENKKNLECRMVLMKYLNNRHSIFNDTKDASEEEINDLFVNELSNILEIDPESAKRLKNSIDVLDIQNEEVRKNLDAVLEKNLNLRDEIIKKKSLVDTYKDEINKKENETEIEYAKLIKNRSKLENKKIDLIDSIDRVKETISTQSCSLKEKLALIKEIDEVKSSIERKQKKIAQYKLIRDDLDVDQRNKIIEIESKVDAWNISLKKTFLPELKSLQIRDKGFHSDDFLEEIKSKLKEKNQLEEILLKEYQTHQTNLRKMDKKLESVIEENAKLNAQTNETIKLVLIEIEKLEMEQREVAKKIETAKKKNERTNKKIESGSSKLSIQAKTLEELDKKKEHELHEVEHITKHNLSSLYAARKSTKLLMGTIDEKMQLLIMHEAERTNEAKEKLETRCNNYLQMEKLIDEASSILKVPKEKK